MSSLNKQMYTSYALLFITVNTFINSKQKFNDPKLSVVKKQSTTTAESACVLTDNNAINWVKIHQFCQVGIWDIRLL